MQKPLNSISYTISPKFNPTSQDTQGNDPGPSWPSCFNNLNSDFKKLTKKITIMQIVAIYTQINFLYTDKWIWLSGRMPGKRFSVYVYMNYKINVICNHKRSSVWFQGFPWTEKSKMFCWLSGLCELHNYWLEVQRNSISAKHQAHNNLTVFVEVRADVLCIAMCHFYRALLAKSYCICTGWRCTYVLMGCSNVPRSICKVLLNLYLAMKKWH